MATCSSSRQPIRQCPTPQPKGVRRGAVVWHIWPNLPSSVFPYQPPFGRVVYSCYGHWDSSDKIAHLNWVVVWHIWPVLSSVFPYQLLFGESLFGEGRALVLRPLETPPTKSLTWIAAPAWTPTNPGTNSRAPSNTISLWGQGRRYIADQFWMEVSSARSLSMMARQRHW
jgi:hypothetical protein